MFIPTVIFHSKKKKKKIGGSAAGKAKDTPSKWDKDGKWVINGKEKKKWLDGMGWSTSSLHSN